MTPLSFMGLCCVLLAKKYTLVRNVVREGDRPSTAGTTATTGTTGETSAVENSTEKLGEVDAEARNGDVSGEKVGGVGDGAQGGINNEIVETN